MRWATILAGGSGTRLQPLTRLWTGDNRPKQFCPLLNGQTLLTQTRRRIAKSVPSVRTVFAVTRDHRPYYRPELAGVPAERIVEQPANLGTAGAIAYSVARIRRDDRKAVIGVFPADHYYEHEGAFSQALDATYRAALRRPDLVFLLATEPTGPEAEYGWIEPGRPVDTLSPDTFSVTRFWEKPLPDMAADLMTRGCLWNTFVMVGGADAFRQLLQSTVPQMARAFDLVEKNRQTESEAVARIYASCQPADFSRDVLMPRARLAAVVRLGDVGWTDLGQPARVLRFLAQHRQEESQTSPVPALVTTSRR